MRVVSDPLVPKIVQRLRRTDAVAARVAERALDELLGEGGLAELTQHELQTFLWFTLADAEEPHRTAAALAAFFELAEMDRYAGIAASPQTAEILQTYQERGHQAGTRAGTKAMDASGILPPDLPELEWGEIMGMDELQAYERIAATLELALAAGELRPGGRGWRATQVRLARQQLSMSRPDGPPLLDRVNNERLELWAEAGGQARRAMAATLAGDLAQEPAPPRDLADRMAPMQWLLEIAAGRAGESAGIPLTVGGNLARRIVQEAAERFDWWSFPDRPPRAESDIWRLVELRTMLQRTGVLRRSARRLILGTRGRPLLNDPTAQWQLATTNLIDTTDFDSAAQEAAMLLLIGARGMVEVRELIREVAEILTGSGWRDTGNGAPPDERDVSRAVWALVRRCGLWSLLDEGKGPGYTTRVRLSDIGTRGGLAALRAMALRPRMDLDS